MVAAPRPAVDYNEMSLDDLIAQAKEEGEIQSVGMPDTWANWVETWEDIEAEYGISHADQDMSSSEELAMSVRRVPTAPRTSVTWVSPGVPRLRRQELTLKYKTSYWDEIPDCGQG